MSTRQILRIRVPATPENACPIIRTRPHRPNVILNPTPQASSGAARSSQNYLRRHPLTRHAPASEVTDNVRCANELLNFGDAQSNKPTSNSCSFQQKSSSVDAPERSISTGKHDESGLRQRDSSQRFQYCITPLFSLQRIHPKCIYVSNRQGQLPKAKTSNKLSAAVEAVGASKPVEIASCNKEETELERLKELIEFKKKYILILKNTNNRKLYLEERLRRLNDKKRAIEHSETQKWTRKIQEIKEETQFREKDKQQLFGDDSSSSSIPLINNKILESLDFLHEMESLHDTQHSDTPQLLEELHRMQANIETIKSRMSRMAEKYPLCRQPELQKNCLYLSSQKNQALNIKKKLELIQDQNQKMGSENKETRRIIQVEIKNIKKYKDKYKETLLEQFTRTKKEILNLNNQVSSFKDRSARIILRGTESSAQPSDISELQKIYRDKCQKQIQEEQQARRVRSQNEVLKVDTDTMRLQIERCQWGKKSAQTIRLQKELEESRNSVRNVEKKNKQLTKKIALVTAKICEYESTYPEMIIGQAPGVANQSVSVTQKQSKGKNNNQKGSKSKEERQTSPPCFLNVKKANNAPRSSPDKKISEETQASNSPKKSDTLRESSLVYTQQKSQQKQKTNKQKNTQSESNSKAKSYNNKSQYKTTINQEPVANLKKPSKYQTHFPRVSLKGASNVLVMFVSMILVVGSTLAKMLFL